MTTLDAVRQRAEADARTYCYYLNPDLQFLQSLLEGLKQNEERYSYPSCPCRLASGTYDYDRDIVCPCDYRDADVQQYGACYCGLYARKDIFEGKTEFKPVPERRPVEKQAKAYGTAAVTAKAEAKGTPVEASEAKKKLWYCKQCGYVVYRDEPPLVCPICKAKREFFAEIKASVGFIG